MLDLPVARLPRVLQRDRQPLFGVRHAAAVESVEPDELGHRHGAVVAGLLEHGHGLVDVAEHPLRGQCVVAPHEREHRREPRTRQEPRVAELGRDGLRLGEHLARSRVLAAPGQRLRELGQELRTLVCVARH